MSKNYEKPLEVFTAIDLEMNQPSKKIISVGAVVGNIKTGKIFQKMNVFVNPHEQLNPGIIELTGITQKDVDNGFTLEEAYNKIKAMHENYFSFVNPIVWGGGDSVELKEQILKENPNFDETQWCFGRRWIDAKTLYVSWRLANGKTMAGGLAKALTKVGLKFQGRIHNSADDSENTFYIYRIMLNLMKER